MIFRVFSYDNENFSSLYYFWKNQKVYILINVFIFILYIKNIYNNIYNKMSSNKSILQFPNKKQFIITVPMGLVLAKDWKKGDTLEFSINNKGEIIIKKLK